MPIICYLFSNMTRQINHTYYSLHGSSMGPSKFFYNLKDYKMRTFSLLDPFIYEVEIYPESIVGCFEEYIEARKYKIVREVNFIEYLKELDLSKETTEEFNSILNGNCSELELAEELQELLQKKILDLTIYERVKFMVILNQTKINFPLISLDKDYQIHYIKILEFYKIAYDYSKLSYHKSLIENQKWFGIREFEIISNQSSSIFKDLFSNHYHVSHLILARKMTQDQFEVFCEEALTGGYVPNLKDSALISGYEIPTQYLDLFSPNIFHKEPEFIMSFMKYRHIDTNLALKLLEYNYMIEGFDYSGQHFQKILKAKKIFLKDDFKMIKRG